jgi:hypothetical protein
VQQTCRSARVEQSGGRIGAPAVPHSAPRSRGRLPPGRAEGSPVGRVRGRRQRVGGSAIGGSAFGVLSVGAGSGRPPTAAGPLGAPASPLQTDLTVSDFVSLFVFVSLLALSASDLSRFQGPKVIQRWAPATPASRKWDGRVAWCARGVTAGALAGAAKGGLAQLSRRLERDDRNRTGRRSRYAPGADGKFLANGFLVMLRAVGARHLGGCDVWGHRRRGGRCGAQSDSGGGPYNSWATSR